MKTPEVLNTPIWGVRLLVQTDMTNTVTYTLDVTKWKVFLWLTWRSALNAYTKHFHE